MSPWVRTTLDTPYPLTRGCTVLHAPPLVLNCPELISSLCWQVEGCLTQRTVPLAPHLGDTWFFHLGVGGEWGPVSLPGT